MKSSLIVALIIVVLLLGAVLFLEKKEPLTTKVFNSNQEVLIEHLSGTVTPGLNKIQLNDSTVILIYRGVESCTMIQLK